MSTRNKYRTVQIRQVSGLKAVKTEVDSVADNKRTRCHQRKQQVKIFAERELSQTTTCKQSSDTILYKEYNTKSRIGNSLTR